MEHTGSCFHEDHFFGRKSLQLWVIGGQLKWLLTVSDSWSIIADWHPTDFGEDGCPFFFFFFGKCEHTHICTHSYSFLFVFFFFCKAVWRVLVLTPKSDNKHCSAEWGITETLSAQYTVHLPGRTVQNCSVWQCYVFLIGPERKPMKHPPLPDNKTVHYILYQCC